MELLNIFLIIFFMFSSIILLDSLWLGFLIKKFIIREFKGLIEVKKDGNIKINLFAGVLTWIAIAIGCYIFVLRNSESFFETAFFGALFGFILYVVYDLTNLTFLKNYSKKFVFLDIAWGTFLCMMISLVGYFFMGVFL